MTMAIGSRISESTTLSAMSAVIGLFLEQKIDSLRRADQRAALTVNFYHAISKLLIDALRRAGRSRPLSPGDE